MKFTLMAVFMVLKLSSLIAGSANVGVLVVDDEQNTPVANVDVVAYFTINSGRRAWNESSMPNKDYGVTDVHGQCRFSGKTNCGEVVRSSSPEAEATTLAVYSPAAESLPMM